MASRDIWKDSYVNDGSAILRYQHLLALFKQNLQKYFSLQPSHWRPLLQP